MTAQDSNGFGQWLNRRRAGRIPCEMVTCELGRVVDLSATGLRARSFMGMRPPVGAFVVLHLRWCGGVAEFPARVVRVSGRGLGRREIAVAFEGLTDVHRQTLNQILRGASIRRMIGPDLERRSA